MAITLPKAGNIAGRAAAVQIAAPQAGGIIAEFGDAVAQTGRQWKAEDLQRQARRTQLDITRDYGQARLQAAQITDPAELEAFAQQTNADIRARYITEDTDPELRDALDLTVQEIGDRQNLAASERVIGLRRSQTNADWITNRNTITTEAATADPDTLLALLEIGEGQIASLQAAGVYDPTQAAEETLKLRQDVYSGRAASLVENDPAAYLAAVEAGEFDAIGGDALSRNTIVAQRNLASLEAAATKEAEAAAKLQSDQIGARLTDMTDRLQGGLTVADEAFLDTPEAQSHPKYASAAAARTLRDQMPDIKMMTVAQLDAAIATERATPGDTAFQQDRIKLLTQWRDDAATGWATRPVEQAQASGLPVPDLPTFDAAQPDAFGAALQNRLSNSAFLRDQGYTTAPALFTEAERAQYRAVIAPGADPAAKVAFAQSLLAATQGDAAPVLTDLQADPVFARTTRLIQQTGNTELATEILRGQQRIEAGTVVLPSKTDFTAAFRVATRGALAEDTPLEEEILATATALYANSPEAKRSIDNEIMELVFQQSVQRAMGGLPDANGVYTVGGIQTVNDVPVSLPPGVAASDADRMFDYLGGQLSGMTLDDKGRFSAATANADPLRGFRTASINGQTPDLGANPEVLLSQLQLYRLGETGTYEFRITSNGRSYTISQAGDPQRRPYRFRLTDLMREAGK